MGDNLDIDISLQDPMWETIPGIEALVHKAVETTISSAHLPREVVGKHLEISIVLANDDLVHILNKEYRDKDQSTNVLTFASIDSDEPQIGDEYNLGDVILSFQTLEREAQEQDKFMNDHFFHLLVHGTLHILGYDHIEEDDANTMETLEIRILEKLGIQNPYIEAIF
ncbi:MAG: rRNA maturation RNase YbeY [Alphaproteobacteria bacterium]|nr:rRNA maturation RNase YbeY [Alphaproteobacteria bacterium]